MPWEILHRAAPCRNVPVTFTLERMDYRISPAVVAFAETARGFCVWCESGGGLSDVQAATWLCRLYGQALALPPVAPENAEGLLDIPPDTLARAAANLSDFNGRYYRKVFDPDPTLDEPPVVGDLGDDLIDTYRDIRRGLLLFDRGETVDALWHWSFLHRIHWGRHCVGALQGLHGLSLSQEE